MYKDIRKTLDELTEKNLNRTLNTYFQNNEIEIIKGNTTYINFASNNYLNLATDERLKEASIRATERYGTGSSASRLITGTHELTEQLETKIASFKQKDSAIVFNTGYTANLGTIQALNFNKPVFLVDKYAHASIIDGLKFSGANFKRFRHNDFEHLENLLKKNHDLKTIWIVVDSVYSMEGDRADIKHLVTLKKKYKNIYLYVDEAHATGILGQNARGLTEPYHEDIDIIMGTFSKAFGSFGAFVCSSNLVRDLIINLSRPLIYTTALPLSVIAANIESIKIVIEQPKWGSELIKKALHLIEEIKSLGYDTMNSNTQIIPINLKSNDKTLLLSEMLKKNGILGLAIRTPTVPINSSRIRLTLTRFTNESHTNQLLHVLKSAKDTLLLS